MSLTSALQTDCTASASQLSAGVIARQFPIASRQLKAGESQIVGYYGDLYKIMRTGEGPYDLHASRVGYYDASGDHYSC